MDATRRGAKTQARNPSEITDDIKAHSSKGCVTGSRPQGSQAIGSSGMDGLVNGGDV